MDYTFGIQKGREGVGCITISGKIGATAVDELGRLLVPDSGSESYPELVLDCRGIKYISSAGLQVFMRAIQARKRAGLPKMTCRVLARSYFFEVLVSVGLSDHLTIRTQ